jgi:hypothetical protein
LFRYCFSYGFRRTLARRPCSVLQVCPKCARKTRPASPTPARCSRSTYAQVKEKIPPPRPTMIRQRDDGFQVRVSRHLLKCYPNGYCRAI